MSTNSAMHQLQTMTRSLSDEELAEVRAQVERENNQFRIRAIEAENRKKQEAIFKGSYISERLKEATFDNYVSENKTQEKIRLTCKRYVEIFDKKKPMNLFLTGNYGTGKSHLAAAIHQELSSKKKMNNETLVDQYEYKSLFINLPDLVDELTSGYADNSRREKFESIKNVDLLIIDDFGAEKKDNERGSISSDLLMIFKNRDESKHTVITTNLKPKEILQRYGKRLAEVVLNDRVTTTLVFDWESERNINTW